MASLTEHLRELVDETTRTLPGVTWKRMFGCDAAFVNDQIFALIWREGRIGLKLPEPGQFNALMGLDGSAPWCPGKLNAMSKWVLVPEAFHDDQQALDPWVRKAHALVSSAPPKPARKKRPTPKPRRPSKRARSS